MNNIGINGFGRIGKCVFLQLIDNPTINITAINSPGFDINKIKAYLKNDSTHNYNKLFNVEIIDETTFSVNGRKTHIFNTYDAKLITWKDYGINYIIDATGAFLTQEKASAHDVDYVIMSAPAKDNTPLFVHGANLDSYKGESIVSGASCTTNCITPVLRHLSEQYGIDNANFTTIHSSTSTQYVVDSSFTNSRTSRSILNNIIPHTTGASASISKVLPELDGKIVGTSIRVPTNNVSIVDLNVELNATITLDDIFETMKTDEMLNVVVDDLVSSDFMSTECPSNVDRNASMHLGGNRFKLMIWYDNEWSYASQVIKLINHVINHSNKNNFFIENYNFKGKNVVLRLDLNVPVTEGIVTDDFRIRSTMPTIHRILKDKPNRLVILSHNGRPNGWDMQYSLSESIHPLLEMYLGRNIHFLKKGISKVSLNELECVENTNVFLLENIRFHDEEMNYAVLDSSSNDVIQNIQLFGNFYVNDAFGCLHRNHLSITGLKYEERAYGYLIENELNALNIITNNQGDGKILAIIGGSKIDDKLELLKNLCKKVDTIFIAGGNINSLIKNNMSEYLTEINSHKARIVLMCDGLCARNLEDSPKHISTSMINANSSENFFDIGIESLCALQKLISEHDIVFWNGTLGMVEDDRYKKGSELLVNTLINAMKMQSNKKVIVGGGDTGGFVNKYDNNFTHISTGGGSSIEYITFNTLIGFEIFK
jgi:glyceraldehyde 3-phosphate dehydrogenase